MIKILFVGRNNICRSAMAEFIMKDIVTQKGIRDMFEIKSAATSADEVGRSVYTSAKRKLEENGLSCKGKKAVRMTRREYALSDYVVVMDSDVLREVKKIMGRDVGDKLSRLLDHTSRPEKDIDDPWYSRKFDEIWCDVSAGCTGLCREIMEKYHLCL